jgi:hypothetical protein
MMSSERCGSTGKSRRRFMTATAQCTSIERGNRPRLSPSRIEGRTISTLSAGKRRATSASASPLLCV